MPLSEHVYCVAVPFEMNEQVEQQISLKFHIKLEHSSVGTMQLWATGDWQLRHNNTPALVSRPVQCFGKTSNHPGDSAPPSAQIWCPVTSGFSQN